MKLILAALMTVSALVAAPREARAELQCWVLASNTHVSVQNAAQCLSYDSRGIVYDTVSQVWVDPATGQTSLTPRRAAASQADCGPNETYYPSAGDTGTVGGVCQPNNAPSITTSVTNNQTPQVQAAAQTLNPSNASAYDKAFCSKGSCTYIPLEPLPFLPNTYGPASGSIGSWITSGFKLLIGAGAILAVVMIVLGALTYMFSDVVGDKFKAKTRIRNAMWGVVLLLSSYLILYTINPELTTFNLDLKPFNNYNTSPAVGTRITISNPHHFSVYNGPNAHIQVMELQNNCQSPKSLHRTEEGADAIGPYVVWSCL